MKRKVLYSFFTAFILCVFFQFSCQKEPKYDNIPNPIPSVPTITATVTGRVTDENKVPVKGATVKAGTVSTLTDVNGTFTISNALLVKNAGFVSIEKPGYFKGIKTFVVNTTASNFIEIELIPKTIAGTITNSAGGTINATNGGSIQFSAGGIVNTSNNTVYNGTVSVSAYLISPDAANFNSIMPGDLRGLTTANQERALQSYGMMAVELTGAGGEILNLASGKTATITFPIPAAMQAQAPSSIPLWYFDENTGLWKEEGTANKQGSNYVGTVAHFSFWNVDYPYPLVDFSATFMNTAAQPLSNAKVMVRIMGDSATTAGSGITDTLGRVMGKIPANKNLQLLVYNSCGTLLHTQAMGPFQTNTNLGSITVNAGNNITVTFAGVATDCNNSPLSSGYITIVLNGKTYRTNISNGAYTTSLNVCNQGTYNAVLTAYDQTSNMYGNAVTVTVNSAASVNSNLSACGNTATEFIKYSIGNKYYWLSSPADSLIFSAYSYNNIYAYGNTPSRFFSIDLNRNDTLPGTYAVPYLHIFESGVYDLIKQGTFNVTITQFGPKNEFITGTFNGTARDSIFTGQPSTYSIQGNFKIKRTQ